MAREFEGVELGDTRLSRRLEEIVSILEARPNDSFPDMFQDSAELEAFYRFMRNPTVNFSKLLEPHIRATISRATEHGDILVLHDTTELDFSGGKPRKGLGRLRQSGHGFLAHLSLAVTADGSRDVLGLLASHTWARTKKTATAQRSAKQISYKESRTLPREQERWTSSVSSAERQLRGKGVSAVHVMDSEADDFTGLVRMVDQNRRFVIRMCYNRVLDPVSEGEGKKIRDAIEAKPIVCTREVTLSRRRRLPAGGRRRTCEREEREATLAVSAGTVVVRRPASVETDLPETLKLNVVHVWELDPPSEVEPVEWHLLSTEPIGTEEQILKIVGSYCCRWLIEEYIKVLKTGCAYEERQLESYHTLLNALALFIPIAWKILRLRTLSRSPLEYPAGHVLTDDQVEVLKRRYPELMPAQPNLTDALLAVARLGGHLRRNGQPGWLVLIRGYKRLLSLEEGLKLARLPAPLGPPA